MINKGTKKNLLKEDLKVKEITPVSMQCSIGPCPGIFETNKETFIIIGRVLTEQNTRQILQGKVGPGEMAIEVPKELLSVLLAKTS